MRKARLRRGRRERGEEQRGAAGARQSSPLPPSRSPRPSTRSRLPSPSVLLLVVVVVVLSWSPKGASCDTSVGSDGGNSGNCCLESLVVVNLDGVVTTLDAWTGRARGMFSSGGPLVSSSTPATQLHGELSDLLVVPGLDGLIWTFDSSGALTYLPASAPDLVIEPSVACVAVHPDGLVEEAEGCGLLVGEKTTSVYSLDTETGEGLRLGWGEEVLRPSLMGPQRPAVLLQRDEYLVRALHTGTTSQLWNVTVAHIQALDLPVAAEISPLGGEASVGGGSSSKFPLIYYSSSGELAAADPDTREILWSHPTESFVSSIFGLRGSSWVRVIPEQREAPLHSTSAPLSPQALPPSARTFSEEAAPSSALVALKPRQSRGVMSLGDGLPELGILNGHFFMTQASTGHPMLGEHALSSSRGIGIAGHKAIMGLNLPRSSVLVSGGSDVTGRLGEHLPGGHAQALVGRYSGPSRVLATGSGGIGNILGSELHGDLRQRLEYELEERAAAKAGGKLGASSSEGLLLTWEQVVFLAACISLVLTAVALLAYRYGGKKLKIEGALQRQVSSLGNLLRRGSKVDEAKQAEGDVFTLTPALAKAERSLPDSRVRGENRMGLVISPPGAALQHVTSMPVFDTSMDGSPTGDRNRALGMMNASHSSHPMERIAASQHSPQLEKGELEKLNQQRNRVASGAAGRQPRPQQLVQGDISTGSSMQTMTLSLPNGEGQDILLSNQRYAREFQEGQQLGKGGFGTVYRCSNRLDGRDYAIKKIRLSSDIRRRRDLEKVLREVKILAFLDHNNIVRYYQAWLEKAPDNALGDEAAARASLDTDYTSSLGYFAHDTYASSIAVEDSSLLWSQPSTETENEEDENNVGLGIELADSSIASIPGFEFERPQTPIAGARPHPVSPASPPSARAEIPPSMHGRQPTGAVIWNDLELYIQMQYCSESTLQTHLESRARVDMARVLHSFVQISKGIKYVHRTGLIHRDLKPANCFLLADGTVKIGDFGLSRHAVPALQSSPGSSLKAAASNGSSPGNSRVRLNMDMHGDITSGVGTLLYASPEQMSGGDYDEKTDVFSLGMMLFEMSHPPFGTSMERIVVLSDAHKWKFPAQWDLPKAHDELSNLVTSMLLHNPVQRPSAADVVHRLEALQGMHMVLDIDNDVRNAEGHATVSVVLRVEVEEKEGLLHKLVEKVRSLCAQTHTARLDQYGLRGSSTGSVIEFLIGGAVLEEREAIITSLLALAEVKSVREFPAGTKTS